MDGMFAYATNFNQPVNFNTQNVDTMYAMFASALSFNQPIAFNATSLTSASSIFESALTLNSSVTLTPSLALTSVQRMFYNTTSFNQPVILKFQSVCEFQHEQCRRHELHVCWRTHVQQAHRFRRAQIAV